MEVINARSAFLSNYEVLSLLRELDADHLARTKTAHRIKKEEEAAGNAQIQGGSRELEMSENLRTVEVEAIAFLSADFQPTSAQSPAGITKLVKDLAPYSLTKAEKLQIVNLAPTEPVELYVIVEELEDRMQEHMDTILERVNASLNSATESALHETIVNPIDSADNFDIGFAYAAQSGDLYGEPDPWGDPDEPIFDDTGEGAGIEGDLDMEDD